MAVTVDFVALREPRFDTFDDLYAACQPRVFRTCLAILRNAEDAAEATQEVFSRALPLLTELREPHVWLQTVARNYCLDQLRRQKVRGGGGVVDESTAGTGDDPEREALLRDALRQAFEALSPRERRALARVLLMDDSLADIARMLDISYGAAAQVVSRARRRAAIAARAVMGATFVLLGRIGISRGDRGRTLRVVGQLADTGQSAVLVAAAVVFSGAGALSAAVAAPSGDGVSGVWHSRAIAPAAAAVHGVDVADVGAPSSGLAQHGAQTSAVQLPASAHGLWTPAAGFSSHYGGHTVDSSGNGSDTPAPQYPGLVLQSQGSAPCQTVTTGVGPSTTMGGGVQVQVQPFYPGC